LDCQKKDQQQEEEQQEDQQQLQEQEQEQEQPELELEEDSIDFLRKKNGDVKVFSITTFFLLLPPFPGLNQNNDEAETCTSPGIPW